MLLSPPIEAFTLIPPYLHHKPHRHAKRLRPDVDGALAASVVVIRAAARDLTLHEAGRKSLAPYA